MGNQPEKETPESGASPLGRQDRLDLEMQVERRQTGPWAAPGVFSSSRWLLVKATQDAVTAPPLQMKRLRHREKELVDSLALTEMDPESVTIH